MTIWTNVRKVDLENTNSLLVSLIVELKLLFLFQGYEPTLLRTQVIFIIVTTIVQLYFIVGIPSQRLTESAYLWTCVSYGRFLLATKDWGIILTKHSHE